jgi:ABC-type branched-subunit amino acid transport system substrate-binding protein
LVAVLSASSVPMIGNRAVSSADNTNSYSFPVDGGTPVTYSGIGIAAGKAGCKRIAGIYPAVGEKAGLADFVQAGVAVSGGGQYTDTTYYPATTGDFSPVASRVLRSQPDCIALAVNSSDAFKIIPAVRQLDKNVRFVTSSGNLSPSDLKVVGSNSEGTVFADSYYPLDSSEPAIKQFVFEMRTTNGSKAVLDAYSIRAWTAVNLFVKAARKSTDLSGVAIASTLSSLGVVDLGVLAPIDMGRPLEMQGYTRILNTKMLVETYTKGKFVLTSKGFEDVRPALQRLASRPGGGEQAPR